MVKIKIQHLLSILATPLVILPTSFITSCSVIDTNNFRVFDFSKNLPINFYGINNPSISFKELIYGSKKCYDGNYIVIFGSNANWDKSKNVNTNNANKIFVNPIMSGNLYVDYSIDNLFTESEFSSEYQTLQDWTVDNDATKFGVFMYFDILTKKAIQNDPFAKHQESDGLANHGYSYDSKWTSEDVKLAEDIGINNVKKEIEVVKEGEYVRKDQSAVKMRDTINYLSHIFGDKFNLKEITNMPYALVWKDGAPIFDSFKQISKAEDITSLIRETFIDKQDDEEEKK